MCEKNKLTNNKKEGKNMMNKKLVSATLVGLMAVGVSATALAETTQDINGKTNVSGENKGEMTVRGSLGEVDNTDPEGPIDEHSDKWINVTFPTAVVFGTNDGKTITSSADYAMTNNSGRHVQVNVNDYVIDQEKSDAQALEALTELQIQSSQDKAVTLAKNGASVVDSNKSFAVIDTKESIEFGFSGKINDKIKLGEKAYVESNVVFEFKVLPKSANEK